MGRLTDKQQHILRQKLCDMKRRCYNPKSKFYKDYGGRGIKVCDEWMDKKNGHANFQKWALESGWHEFLTIDRIDVNGNYEPSNCRWATPKEQSNNRRDNNYITIGGVTKTAQEWADQVGISMNGFKSRINSGWSEEELLQPKKKPLKMTKAEMAKEIRYWRSLEEQGLLVKFPCRVGDILWNIENGELESFVVEEFRISTYKIDRIEIYFENASGFGLCLFDGTLDEGWYKTKEEAEKALAEMEKKDE